MTDFYALELDIRGAINKHNAENGSDTPDYLLAEFLIRCLEAYNRAVLLREQWHGRKLQGIHKSEPSLLEPKTEWQETHLEDLLADKRRLDWLNSSPDYETLQRNVFSRNWFTTSTEGHATVRDAIDAAMNAHRANVPTPQPANQRREEPQQRKENEDPHTGLTIDN